MSNSKSKYTIYKASAGTGKTHTLTEQISEKIFSDKNPEQATLKPAEIIATTFTVQAANQLAYKIREKLLKNGRTEEALQVSDALIGTVNSVAGRIVTEFAIEKELSPNLTLITEEAQKMFFDKVIDGVIAKTESDPDNRDLLKRMGMLRLPTTTFQEREQHPFKTAVETITRFARMNDIATEKLNTLAEASIADFKESSEAEFKPGIKEKVFESLKRLLTEYQKEIDNIKRQNWKESNEKNLASIKKYFDGLTKRPLHSFDWSTLFELNDFKLPSYAGKSTSFFKKAVVAVGESHGTVKVYEDQTFLEDMTKTIVLTYKTATECLEQYADFKAQLGLIDYIDQEQLALSLLDKPEVQKEIEARYKYLAVDEFQDTSPIQLALFSKIGDLITKKGEVLWVGDAKQSIYGFRGSDAELMEAVVQEIRKNGGKVKRLSESWRTDDIPLQFTNTLFSKVFPDNTGQHLDNLENKNAEKTNPEVHLEVATKREGDHTGGSVKLWFPDPEDKAREGTTKLLRRTVAGVLELLPQTTATESIAVLTRSRNDAYTVSELLQHYGVATSGRGKLLAETKETLLLISALKWLTNYRDNASLIEMIVHLNDHAAHKNWLQQLTAAKHENDREKDREARAKLLESWENDATFIDLKKLKTKAHSLGLIKLLKETINALDLRARITQWGNKNYSEATISTLINVTNSYVNESLVSNIEPNLQGLIAKIFGRSAEQPRAQVTNTQSAVYVDTIHSAKGLAWDHVITIQKNAAKELVTPGGAWLVSPKEISVQDPLKDREIRFWPHIVSKSEQLTEKLSESAGHLKRHQLELAEAQRLLYVAITRSKKTTVVSLSSDMNNIVSFKHSDLTVITDNAAEDADNVINVTGMFESVELSSAENKLEKAAAKLLETRDKEQFIESRLWPERQNFSQNKEEETTYAIFSPSSIGTPKDTGKPVNVQKVGNTEAVGHFKGTQNWDALGDCVHSYLAILFQGFTEETLKKTAQRMVTKWNVTNLITPEQLTTIGERWKQWHTQTFTNKAVVETEVPFVWKNQHGQRTQGWIDHLVKLENGNLAVIDHKTYPGENPEKEIAEKYAEQLRIYQTAVAEITGKQVEKILVHMPLRGEIFEIK